jgi:hypothetical protein
MPGITYDQQTKIREAVKTYLHRYGVTSLRKIAAYVLEKTGIETTPTTISRIVRDEGYDNPTTSWEKVKK